MIYWIIMLWILSVLKAPAWLYVLLAIKLAWSILGFGIKAGKNTKG